MGAGQGGTGQRRGRGPREASEFIGGTERKLPLRGSHRATGRCSELEVRPRGKGNSRIARARERPTRIEKGASMKQFMGRVKQFLKSEDGPTATEYAVMLALIIIIALGAISALGTKVSDVFTNVESNLPDGNG